MPRSRELLITRFLRNSRGRLTQCKKMMARTLAFPGRVVDFLSHERGARDFSLAKATTLAYRRGKERKRTKIVSRGRRTRAVAGYTCIIAAISRNE